MTLQEAIYAIHRTVVETGAYPDALFVSAEDLKMIEYEAGGLTFPYNGIPPKPCEDLKIGGVPIRVAEIVG